MSRSSIEMAIADRVGAAEKITLAALGHDNLDVAMMGFAAYCGVMLIAVEPERSTIWPRTDTTVTGRR